MELHDPATDRPQVRTALLLAAGLGMRLAPLTVAQPKCLVSVSGTPILERLVRALDGHGIERLVIVAGYRAEMIRDYLGESFGGIAIEYLVSPLFADHQQQLFAVAGATADRRAIPACRERRGVRRPSPGASAAARPDRLSAAAALDGRHYGHPRRQRQRQGLLPAAPWRLRPALHRPGPLHGGQHLQPRARHLGRGLRATRPPTWRPVTPATSTSRCSRRWPPPQHGPLAVIFPTERGIDRHAGRSRCGRAPVPQAAGCGWGSGRRTPSGAVG